MQLLEDLLPSAVLTPSVKALKDRVILAEAFGQIGPGRTGASNPEYSIDKAAVVLGGAPGVACFTRKQVLNTLPLFVRDLLREPSVS